MFITRIILCPSHLSLYLLQMVVKGGLFVLVLAALLTRSSAPITRGCAPLGYHPTQALMHFTNPEDSGLLWLYTLYTPPSAKKLTRNEKLLNTRSLIVILLIIGGIESHPGEFYKYYFYYPLPYCLG